MADHRLPPALRDDPQILELIHEAVVGAGEVTADLRIPGTTPGQHAVVALLLTDAEIVNGGFGQLRENWSDSELQAARDAAERLGALEHRRLLDTGGDSKWYALDDLLEQRLKAYVEAHPDDFFAESAAARANEARVRAKLADDAIWLVETQADIDREIEAQEWLVDQFGARGRYSQESEWLLLRPEAMREALGAVASAGYAPRELIFLDEDQVIIETVDVEREPEIELQAGVERHEPAWVAVIAR